MRVAALRFDASYVQTVCALGADTLAPQLLISECKVSPRPPHFPPPPPLSTTPNYSRQVVGASHSQRFVAFYLLKV